MRFLDAADPKQRWVLLDDSTGTLVRSYAALLKTNDAILQKGRKGSIEKEGRYEFVYLIGSIVKEASLIYGQDRPDVPRPVTSFKVPWK
jgi:hypothetical protein